MDYITKFERTYGSDLSPVHFMEVDFDQDTGETMYHVNCIRVSKEYYLKRLAMFAL